MGNSSAEEALRGGPIQFIREIETRKVCADLGPVRESGYGTKRIPGYREPVTPS
jgi:hypothetical protein